MGDSYYPIKGSIFLTNGTVVTGPLSLVSATEELLVRPSSGSGLETENTAVGIRCTDQAAVARPV
jgi:hypothetical protein